MSDREQPRDLTPPTAGQWKVVGLELAHRCTFCGRPSSATVGCPDDGAPVLWQAGQDAEGPLARIDEALALAQQTEQRWTDAFLHRIRGDILLKAHPANPARAEDAYHAALAVARAGRPQLRLVRSPSFTNRPAAQPKPTPSSRLRSKASRPLLRCRRSLRRRRCSNKWRAPGRTRGRAASQADPAEQVSRSLSPILGRRGLLLLRRCGPFAKAVAE